MSGVGRPTADAGDPPLTADPPAPPGLVTLPAAAVRLGVTPDRLRRLIRTDAVLGGLFRRAGGQSVCEAADLPAVAVRLAPPAPPAPPAV